MSSSTRPRAQNDASRHAQALARSRISILAHVKVNGPHSVGGNSMIKHGGIDDSAMLWTIAEASRSEYPIHHVAKPDRHCTPPSRRSRPNPTMQLNPLFSVTRQYGEPEPEECAEPEEFETAPPSPSGLAIADTRLLVESRSLALDPDSRPRKQVKLSPVDNQSIKTEENEESSLQNISPFSPEPPPSSQSELASYSPAPLDSLFPPYPLLPKLEEEFKREEEDKIKAEPGLEKEDEGEGTKEKDAQHQAFTSLADIWSHTPPVLPPDGPPCRKCRRPSTLGFVPSSNRNGNALRPFYRCVPCNKWATWADLRGVRAGNAPCSCGEPSRICVTGWRALCGPGRKFWVCAEGRCEFASWVPVEEWEEQPSPKVEKDVCSRVIY